MAGFDYSVPRYWYHITKEDLGDTVYLNPVATKNSPNRCCSEPEIARICVAPTIPQCIVAIPLEYDLFNYDIFNSKGIYVYQTIRRKIAIKPFFPKNEKKYLDSTLPFDYKVTNEGWLLRDTKFRFIGKLNVDFGDKSIQNINFETCCDDNPQLTGKVLKKITDSKSFLLLGPGETSIRLIDFNHGIGRGIRKSKKEVERACVLA